MEAIPLDLLKAGTNLSMKGRITACKSDTTMPRQAEEVTTTVTECTKAVSEANICTKNTSNQGEEVDRCEAADVAIMK